MCDNKRKKFEANSSSAVNWNKILQKPENLGLSINNCAIQRYCGFMTFLSV